MFLQYILKEDEDSLIHKFLLAQIEDPKTGDWWLSILQDIEELDLAFTLHDIKHMTRDRFKTEVENAAKKAAFKVLTDKKARLDKVKIITHEELELQPYLRSPALSTHQTKFLFQLRSRMLFLRENYSHTHKDTFCPLCSKAGQTGERFRDTQEHLLTCTLLHVVSEISETGLEYRDIYGTDLAKQAKMTILLESKYRKRKQLE